MSLEMETKFFTNRSSSNNRKICKKACLFLLILCVFLITIYFHFINYFSHGLLLKAQCNCIIHFKLLYDYKKVILTLSASKEKLYLTSLHSLKLLYNPLPN